MGGQAGAPVVEHVVDMALLDPLLADAPKRRTATHRSRTRCSSCSCPRGIKLALSTGGSLTAARRRRCQLPWEMLVATTRRRGRNAPNRSACRAVSCAGSRREGDPSAGVARAGKAALVIGNPPVGRPGHRCPGACQRSATGREDPARSEYEVTRLIFDVDGTPVVDDRARTSARDPFASGLTTSTRITGRRSSTSCSARRIPDRAHRSPWPLRADDPERSVRMGRTLCRGSIFGSLPSRPDFVFFNCCHLGRSTRHRRLIIGERREDGHGRWGAWGGCGGLGGR